jgi:hypothetical protein
MPLTAPVQRLSETITPNRRVDLTLDPMGHDVSSAAPTGLATGLLRPRATAAATGDPQPLVFAEPPEPVPSDAAVPLRWGAQRLADTVEPASTGAAHAPVPVAPPPVAMATNVSPPVSTSTPSPDPTVQRLAEPVASTAPPALPPLAARRLASRVQPEPTEPEPESVGRVSQELPHAAPSPVQPTPLVVQRLGAEGPAPAGDNVTPLFGTTRVIRRMGEPLRSRPPGMQVPSHSHDELPVVPAGAQRLAAPAPAVRTVPLPGELPPQRPFATTVIDAPPAATTASDDGPVASGLPPLALVGGPGRSAPVAVQAVQRLASTGGVPSATPAPVPVRRGPTPSTVQRSPGVQRSPEGVPSDLRTELEPVLQTSLSDVKVHRDADTGRAAAEMNAQAFTTGGEVFLPEWHGSTSSGQARSILAHELTHVAQQRVLGDRLPPEDSPEGGALEHEARVVGGQAPAVASRPVVAGVAQRLAGEHAPVPVRPVPVVPGSQRAGGAVETGPTTSQAAIAAQVRAAALGAGIPVVSAAPGSSPHAGTDETMPVQRLAQGPVQRAMEIGPITTAVSPSTPADSQTTQDPGRVQTAETQAPPPQPANAEVSEPDLDELARRLYPRFRSRLRRDLLSDRERSGRLFDLQ